ncbi:class I SAM-dependent methyltransferase [Silvanigrella sp.]|jgi:ubiquinone/menaquinone biosynthesis C-methylase UbiE|uniref:class I SAM-dependent methyltransferase n=1 Tax=Silvanigrella sp. TaxID=2024976 RepID=UPI0037CAF9AC
MQILTAILKKKWTEYKNIITSNILFHNELHFFLFKTIEEYSKKINKNITLIDLGCGDSSNVISVLKNFKIKKYIGVDNTKLSINLSSQNLQELDCEKELHHNEMDDFIYKISDSSIDIIFSSFALHHIRHERKEIFIEECNKKLKKEGILFIADPLLNDSNCQDDFINEFEKRMIESNLNPTEINEMINHCKKYDYHEKISFYHDLSLKVKWSSFNLLFSSNFISFFTFIN